MDVKVTCQIVYTVKVNGCDDRNEAYVAATQRLFLRHARMGKEFTINECDYTLDEFSIKEVKEG